jgi:Sulfotransferase family
MSTVKLASCYTSLTTTTTFLLFFFFSNYSAATIMTNSFQSYADDKPRIHFVHINKTGGSSILEMLLDRCERQYVEESWNGRRQRTFHATAHALIDHNGRDAWDNAYTFTVVRHPLARAVSNFFFLIEKCAEGSPSEAKCRSRLIPTQIDLDSMSTAKKIEAFHRHIQVMYHLYPPGSHEQHLFGSLGHGNQLFDTFNATQTSWLVDEDGKMAVKRIFRLESLSEDMAKLAEDLPCLQNDPEGRRKLLEMAHENAGPNYPDYKLFGRNQRTNEIFREVYAVDYQNFGYDFP